MYTYVCVSLSIHCFSKKKIFGEKNGCHMFIYGFEVL